MVSAPNFFVTFLCTSILTYLEIDVCLFVFVAVLSY